MLAVNLTDSELRKEIRKLERNIKRRVERIEGLGDTAPQIATQKFRDFQPSIPKSLKGVETKKLQSIYRQLRYINQLKTSTVKGAIKAQEYYEKIFNRIDTLSQDFQNKFWKAYGRVYEKNPMLDKFKYEIMETVIDKIFEAKDYEQIAQQIIDIADEISESHSGGNGISDEKFKILFTDRLRKLRNEP